MAELKPCPFCGAELEKRSNKRWKIVYMHHPMCGACMDKEESKCDT